MNNLNLSDEVLARRVFRPDIYKRLIHNTLLSVLPGKFIDLNKITIDVGAAAGLMTHWFSHHSRQVFSFEAVPPVWEQLRKMEDLGNVVTRNIAISDHKGEEVIYVDHKRLSNSGFQDLVGGPSIIMPVDYLDNLFEAREQIGFIKIDVEGTELDVLHGAKRIIEKQRPNFMIEIYEPFSKYPLNSIFDLLMDDGYRCAYFNPQTRSLVEIKDPDHGVDVVKTKHKLHDGDFIFFSE